MTPRFDHYTDIISTLFAEFQQTNPVELANENLQTFTDWSLILFFMLMQFRRIKAFKAQHRWLATDNSRLAMFGWSRVPDRSTLSRRYKQLSGVLTAFVHFTGQATVDLDERFANNDLVEDKSLFKAAGPVWHQSDRAEKHVPKGLRNLDKDATWSKSSYHGWVYGYGLHITCTNDAFPKLIQIETASTSEGTVLDQKVDTLWTELKPDTLTTDDGYTKVTRIRNWAKQGICLITPASRWVKGRYAQAYHTFLKRPESKRCLHKRKISVEPLFDLIAKVIGVTDNHKQLDVQRLVNVRTCLALGTLSVQIAMIMNSVWGLPLRNISHMIAVFS